MLVVATITIAVLAGIMFKTSLFEYFPASVVACCAILPMAGYAFGFLLGYVAKETPKCTYGFDIITLLFIVVKL